MVTATELQRAMVRSADTLDGSRLVGVDEIAHRAAGRRRRQRAVLGAAATLLVALGCVGILGAVRDADPTTVVAAQGDTALDPDRMVIIDAVWRDGRYLALAAESPTETGEPAEGTATGGETADDPAGADRTHLLVESADGQEWDRVPGSPTFTAASAALGEYDGTVVVVMAATGGEAAAAGTGADGDGISDQQGNARRLVVASSPDLVTWTEAVHSVGDDGDDGDEAGQRLVVDRAIAGRTGVLITGYRAEGGWQAAREFEARGYDIDSVCDFTATAARVRFRLCGSPETTDFALESDPTLSLSPEPVVLFAPTPRGSSSEEQEVHDVTSLLPDADDPRRFQSAYGVDGGFGIAGQAVFESADGVEWTRVDTHGEAAVMMAARADERVYRARFGVARFGPDDPVYGMAYRRGDAAWQSLDLSSLYADAERQPRWFNDLQVGPGGWVLVAQRNVTPPSDIGVERDRSGSSDFTLTAADGQTLRGHYPFGPATLSDATGAVVREWELFEAARPDASGWTVDAEGVRLVDDVSGETVVRFTAQQWAVLNEPVSWVVYDVLFSSDGVRWEILTSAAPPTVLPTILSVGENSVLVGLHQVTGHGPAATSTVALPVGGG